MNDDRNSDRWRELVDLHEDFEERVPVLPMRLSGIDGSRIEASPKAVSFARALAIDARWSGIADARRRHSDLAA